MEEGEIVSVFGVAWFRGFHKTRAAKILHLTTIVSFCRSYSCRGFSLCVSPWTVGSLTVCFVLRSRRGLSLRMFRLHRETALQFEYIGLTYERA
jgi:hypothetical protein